MVNSFSHQSNSTGLQAVPDNYTRDCKLSAGIQYYSCKSQNDIQYLYNFEQCSICCKNATNKKYWHNRITSLKGWNINVNAYLSLFQTESHGHRAGCIGSADSSSSSLSPSDVGFPFSSLSSLKKSILCASFVRFSDIDSGLQHNSS